MSHFEESDQSGEVNTRSDIYPQILFIGVPKKSTKLGRTKVIVHWGDTKFLLWWYSSPGGVWNFWDFFGLCMKNSLHVYSHSTSTHLVNQSMGVIILNGCQLTKTSSAPALQGRTIACLPSWMFGIKGLRHALKHMPLELGAEIIHTATKAL